MKAKLTSGFYYRRNPEPGKPNQQFSAGDVFDVTDQEVKTLKGKITLLNSKPVSGSGEVPPSSSLPASPEPLVPDPEKALGASVTPETDENTAEAAAEPTEAPKGPEKAEEKPRRTLSRITPKRVLKKSAK